MAWRRPVRWLAVLLLLLPVLLLLDRRVRRHPPHTAEALEAAGLTWRALRAGAGDTTVVLIHGYGEHLLGWRGVVDPLAARYRVVAFDLPGFGASDKPAGPYTLEAMTGRVAGFVERWTDAPRIVVGHSMGGAIAAHLALERPDLVSALVLIAPVGLDPGLGQLGERLGTAGIRAIGIWEMARAFITPLHDPAWMAEPDDLMRYDPATDTAYRNSTARVLEEFDFAGIGERFADLKLPVLLLWGRFDPVVPAEAAPRILDLLPCGRLVTLPTLHRPQVERPDTVATLLLGFIKHPNCE